MTKLIAKTRYKKPNTILRVQHRGNMVDIDTEKLTDVQYTAALKLGVELLLMHPVIWIRQIRASTTGG